MNCIATKYCNNQRCIYGYIWSHLILQDSSHQKLGIHVLPQAFIPIYLSRLF